MTHPIQRKRSRPLRPCDLTNDQRVVLYALRIVTGRSRVLQQRTTVDLLQRHTADRMGRFADGRRPQPMGLARIRKTLRELRQPGLVIEAKRGWWAIHPDVDWDDVTELIHPCDP